MNSYKLVVFWYALIFSVPNQIGLVTTLDPGILTKIMTALNSIKASLPSPGATGGGDKSSGGSDGSSDKMVGQPTSFHMDDRSPEIEVKTSDMGMDIKTKPASLQVLSTPVEPVHVHAVVEDHHILGMQPHFIAPPEIVHPIQPVYYGGRRHRIHPFSGHFHRGLYNPYGFFPYRNFYYPSHHVVFNHGGGDDYDDDGDDEDGDKKEKIPVTKKNGHPWNKRLKLRRPKYERLHKKKTSRYAKGRHLAHSSVAWKRYNMGHYDGFARNLKPHYIR